MPFQRALHMTRSGRAYTDSASVLALACLAGVFCLALPALLSAEGGPAEMPYNLLKEEGFTASWLNAKIFVEPDGYYEVE